MAKSREKSRAEPQPQQYPSPSAITVFGGLIAALWTALRSLIPSARAAPLQPQVQPPRSHRDPHRAKRSHGGRAAGGGAGKDKAAFVAGKKGRPGKAAG
jgi:hypothetical protein